MAREASKRRRRPRGSGSVYQLHRPACARPAKGCDCIWWVAYRGPDGRRIAESSESHRKGDAERKLQQRVGARENNLPIIRNAERLTFDDAAKAVIDDYTVNRKRSLKATRGRIDNHLRPYFGGRRLVGISAADVTAYVAHRQRQGIERERDVPATDGTIERRQVRAKDVSNATINRELEILKRVFSLAIKSGRIALKPHIALLRQDNVRKGFFEREAFESVRAHLPGHLQPFVLFLYITGWRVSEARGLQWRHVDLKAGEVRLEPGETKNGEGRTFACTTELRRLLETQRAAHQRLKKAGRILAHVFFREQAQGRGGPKVPHPIGEFRKSWAAACRAAGVPGRLVHDFRRTAIRNAVRAGIPERVAMEMSGHETRSVFERYNIISPGDLREAARKLDAVTPAFAQQRRRRKLKVS